MRTCYLHIGTEKTGSTSIQNYLNLNSDLLKSQGVWYSECLGRPNNRKIAVYARNSNLPDDGFLSYNIYDEHQHLNFKHSVESQLKEELDDFYKHDGSTYFISNEHCHSRLSSVTMIKRVYQLLSPYFDTIKVICFLRPQIEVVTSLASTAARVGQYVNVDFFDISSNNYYYKYNEILEKWCEVFGDKNVVPIPFKRNKRTIEYFLSTLQIDSQGLKKLPNSNQAIDISTMAILNSVALSLRKKVLSNSTIDKFPVNEKLKISRNLAQTIQSRFNNINQIVSNRFDQINFDDLVPDWKNYDEVGNLHLLDSPQYLHKNISHMVMKWQKSLDEVKTLKNERNLLTRDNYEFKSQVLNLQSDLSNLKHRMSELINELEFYKEYYNETPNIARTAPIKSLTRFLNRYYNKKEYVSNSILLSELIFDPTYYFNVNQVVQQAVGNNLDEIEKHWLEVGVNMGLESSPKFGVKYYLMMNKDLKRWFKKDYKGAIKHWLEHGIAEGRVASKQTG